MPLKRHFVEKGIQQMQIKEYLSKVLDNSGFAGVEMQKTPLGIRITIKTARPGLVIGRKGMRIRELSEELAAKFGMENPQIDVEAIENPELNAQIMAESIAFGVKKGQNYRRTAYSIMRRIIKSGARGVEVIISGKSTSQRARTQIFRSGIISKCGMPAIEGVDTGLAEAVMKSGTIGIQVKIMPLSYRLPDEIILKDPNLKSIKKIVDTSSIEEKAIEVIVDKKDSAVITETEVPEAEASIFDDVEEVIDDIKVEEVVETPEPEVVEEKPKKKTTKKKSSKKKTSKKKTSKKKSTKKKTSKKKSTKKAKVEEKTEEVKTNAAEEKTEEPKEEKKEKKKRGRKKKE